MIHRIVKGFAIQGGDVVHRDGPDVGEGLASVYGASLRTDENPTGRHLYPGLLGGANRGRNTGVGKPPTEHIMRLFDEEEHIARL